MSNLEQLKNIIRKQSIRFQYNGNTDGFTLQKEVSDWCTLKLIPQIEQQVEIFAPGDKYITIDKLEINAEIDNPDWQQKIQDALLYGLNKKLSSYVPVAGKPGDNKGSISRKFDELVLFFFQKGYLPWWSNTLIAGDFDAALQNWINEEKTQAATDEFRRQLQLIASETVIDRVLNHFPGRLFFHFLKNIFKNETLLIGQTEMLLKEIWVNEVSIAKEIKITQPVYRFILTGLLSNTGTINIDLMLQLLYIELQKQKMIDPGVALTPAESRKASNPVKILWQQLLLQQHQQQSKKKGITGILKEQNKKRKI